MRNFCPILVLFFVCGALASEGNIEHHGQEENYTASQSTPVNGANFEAFDSFIEGLTHLQSVLDNHNSTWFTPNASHSSEHLATGAPIEGQIEHIRDMQPLGIEELFNFVVKIKAVSNDIRNTIGEKNNALETETAEDSVNVTESENRMQSTTTQMELQNNIAPLISVINELSQTLNLYSNDTSQSLSTPPASTSAPQDGLGSVISMLEELLQVHKKYQNTTINMPDASLPQTVSSEENITGLLKIIEDLGKLAGFPDLPTTIPSTTTVTTEVPTPPASCDPPLQEIAYRMCILQVTNKRLNWFDAGNYCRSLGGELAQDAVVIKTRRFLNEMYGEQGTRVRWPFWVGASEVNDGDGWRWEWQEGGSVPDFLWSHKQPRYYPEHLAPRGTCMTLDGFQAFYGAALPCHFRRRFVCQMWK